MFRLPQSGCVRRLVLVCLTTVCLPLPASAQQKAEVPRGRELSPYGLELQWWGHAVLDPAQDYVVHTHVDEDNVYVQSNDGLITAFQAETGRRLWSQLMGSAYKVSLPIGTNESEVYVTVGLQMYALNKFTGELMWELQMPHHPSTAPEADSDHMYVGTVEGSMYCYDIDEIHRLWAAGLLPQWSANAYLWRHKAAQEITSPPISDGTTVAFASLSGTVYSIGCRSHELIFQFETDDPIQTPMGRGAGSLFVTSEDTRLYCLNRETGVRRWTFTAGVPIRTQPQVIGGNLYVAPHGDGLYCLSAASGGIKWRQRRATTFLAATNKYVFAVDSLNNVLLLSPEDGGIEGEMPLRGFSKHLPNERTDRLFLVSPDGLVACIRDQGQEFPIYHKFPERRPILPEMAADDEAAPAADGDAATP